MSDTILAGRWVVYYEAETRQKRLFRDIAVTPTVIDTMQALYSALMDLFDSTVPASEGTPMKFDTPVQYKIGIIDSGDKDPWFIDRESVEYLSGGSLETVSWARVLTTNIGLVTVGCSTLNTIVTGDIGKAISHADGDTGTLLDIQVDLKLLIIRPTDATATHNWDDSEAGHTITCNGHTATQNAAAVTGEQLWANIYTTGLATLQPNTVLGVYQNGAYRTKYKDTIDWWTTGDIDVLVAIKDTVGALIDGGYLTVKANRALTSFSYFIANVSAGGRNPIPLSCGTDLNNVYGNRQMILTDASDEFLVGTVITDDTDPTISGVITSSTGTAPNVTIQYYLIGGLDTGDTPQQHDFALGTGQFTGGGFTATAVDPTDVHGAAVAGCTITHGWTTADINEDGTDEYYSILINCNGYHVADVYQWAQYIARFGGTVTTFSDGIQGQQYIGSDYRLRYSGAVTGTIAEGVIVIQDTTNATGTVVAHNTSQKYIILRNSRGTFNTTDHVHGGTLGSGDWVIPNTAATVISPIVPAPFGTFAGGWYGAPGVVLTNVHVDDVNKYWLTDDLGNPVARPIKVATTVGNTRAGDWIAVFELTAVGGVIKKDSYTLDAAHPTIGSTTIKVDPNIDSKVPGKTDGGIVRIVAAATGREYRYRYVSWSGDVFTLFQLAGTTADAGGSQTSLKDADVDFIAGGVKRGDIVRNVTEVAYGYVEAVALHELTMTNLSSALPVTDWSSDSYRVGVTVSNHSPSNDKVFCPFIDSYEDTGTEIAPGSEVVSVTYVAPIPVRIKARQYKSIVPFSGDSLIGATGMNVNVVRTPDPVAT